MRYPVRDANIAEMDDDLPRYLLRDVEYPYTPFPSRLLALALVQQRRNHSDTHQRLHNERSRSQQLACSVVYIWVVWRMPSRERRHEHWSR